jgi:hypothetical protein
MFKKFLKKVLFWCVSISLTLHAAIQDSPPEKGFRVLTSLQAPQTDLHFRGNTSATHHEPEIQPQEENPLEIPSNFLDPWENPYVVDDMRRFLSKGNTYGSLDQAISRWNPIVLFASPELARRTFIEYYKTHDGFKEYFFIGRSEEDSLFHVCTFSRIERSLFQGRLAELFSHKYFGLSFDPEKNLASFAQRNSISFLSKGLIEETYRTAQRILATTSQGDYLVSFGNTPYFVGRALEKLASKDPKNPEHRKIVFFPFSGSPNRVRPGNYPTPADFIGQENLDFFTRHLLPEQKLTPDNEDLTNHAIHIIDVIASGAGPAFFIETLAREFEKEDKPLPNMNIIALNEINIDDEHDLRNASISQKNIKDGGSGFLSFPSLKEARFEVKTSIILLKDHPTYDFVSENMRVLPLYNACYWKEKYLHYRDTYLDYRPHMKVILDYFDWNIEQLRGASAP